MYIYNFEIKSTMVLQAKMYNQTSYTFHNW